MEKLEPIFNIGPIGITESIIVEWVIMVIIIGLAFWLSKDLKEIPTKKQSAGEIFIETIENFLGEILGEQYKVFLPFAGTLIVFILFLNLTGLVGIEPPTKDYSVALGLSIISFIVIQGYSIRKIGLGHYFVGYAKPMWFMTPLNLMERVMLPVSLSLRLFGNMLAGAFILGMIYDALGNITPVLQAGIPIPVHMFFDLFDGGLQTLIFVLLTLINIKVIAEH